MSVVLPHYNSLVGPTLTDMYQLTMTYALFKQGRQNENCTFDLFIRKSPFKGEYAVFAGLSDALSYIKHFKFTSEDIQYIREHIVPDVEEEFYEFLADMSTDKIEVWSLDEGTIAFPKIPFISISGPVAVVQILETTLLNIVNFATLVTTNATRHCLAVGHKKPLIEFGTRRAQGPDGAIAAAKYAYLGGFVGTSNIKASQLFHIPVMGTHAHSYVMATTLVWDQVRNRKLILDKKVLSEDFVNDVLDYQKELRKKMPHLPETNQNELAAFTAYAIAFPTKFLALIDTYDTVNSGAINFSIVSLALAKYGVKPVGVRLDSGDLAYQSIKVKEVVTTISECFSTSDLTNIKIVASSDISEDVLISIESQPNSITDFGVGTHLVTCKNQPALGGVYKLVKIDGISRMKLSETVEKTTIPNRKISFRLYNSKNIPVIDVMVCEDEQFPEIGKPFLCRDPFNETKCTFMTPSNVERLHKCYFKDGSVQLHLPSLSEIRNKIIQNLGEMRNDHKRSSNPTPYKVSVSQTLYDETHRLWFNTRPIGNIV
jgi:nicotinate phosphoribosyltransferase